MQMRLAIFVIFCALSIPSFAQDFLQEFEGVYSNKVTCRNGTSPKYRPLQDERIGMYADGKWWNSYYVGTCLGIKWGDFEKRSSTKIRYRETGGCKSCGVADVANGDWFEEDYTITSTGLTFSAYSSSECASGPFVFTYTRIMTKPPPFEKIVQAGCTAEPVPKEIKRLK